MIIVLRNFVYSNSREQIEQYPVRLSFISLMQSNLEVVVQNSLPLLDNCGQPTTTAGHQTNYFYNELLN